MKKSTKRIILISIGLIIVGSILCTIIALFPNFANELPAALKGSGL